jgi:hypothetical protein
MKMMTEIRPTPKAQAEALIKGMFKGKEVHDIFTQNFKRQMLISGQSIEHWKEKFKLKIPTDNLTPGMCIDLAMRIMGLSQEATFFHAIAQAKAQMLKRGSDSTYNSKFWSIVQEHKNKGTRLPAAATLETMARIDNDEIDSAETIANIELKFWKDILDHLNMCRRLIENASLNLSVELKAMNSERLLENMGKKNY